MRWSLEKMLQREPTSPMLNRHLRHPHQSGCLPLHVTTECISRSTDLTLSGIGAPQILEGAKTSLRSGRPVSPTATFSRVVQCGDSAHGVGSGASRIESSAVLRDDVMEKLAGWLLDPPSPLTLLKRQLPPRFPCSPLRMT